MLIVSFLIPFPVTDKSRSRVEKKDIPELNRIKVTVIILKRDPLLRVRST